MSMRSGGGGLVGVVGLVSIALFTVACAAEPEPSDRRTAPTPEPTEEEKPIPPGAAGNDGREDSTTMCFAACQNVAFSCKGQTNKKLVFSAQMTFEMPGCWGSISPGTEPKPEETVNLRVDCHSRTVCLGASPGAEATDCISATFSQFSFAFARGNDGNVICTRE